MKKLLAIILIVCTLFSVTALAAETTFVEPYLFFDFGSESRLDDVWKPQLLSNWALIEVLREENEDSWTLTVQNLPEVSAPVHAATQIPQIYLGTVSNMTFGSFYLDNGWGTYVATGYDSATDSWKYSDEWSGKNQFMKIRLKNMTDNKYINIMAHRSGGYITLNGIALFEISTNDTEFQSYVVDICKATAFGYNNGNYDGFAKNDKLAKWPWITERLNSLRLHLFGSVSSDGYCDPSCVTYKNIQLGATVELDYVIFAPTAEMAAEYKSIDEGYVPAETTTQKVETTTTESIVQTTTTESAVETTTTESVVETTTESVVETTTTDAVVDQTTTPQDNSTTTTGENTDTDKEGSFPVWIVIVIAVVIGGGVVAFIVIKKK